jgi:2-C-methyl-D-erythritol 4-phosphate cytidylyltransferase
MATPPRLFALIPAAGGGTRFGAEQPKQYAMLMARPVIARTIERLASALEFARIVVALAPDDTKFESMAPPGTAVMRALRCGGATRAETVRNALADLGRVCGDDDWVLVHDAARPCVPVDALRRLTTELADEPIGGLLAVPITDTVKREDNPTRPRVLSTEPRDGLWQAQTPQMFRYRVLADALARDGALAATDEAQAVEATGARPRLVLGSSRNVKITYQPDLALAAAILAAQEHGG